MHTPLHRTPKTDSAKKHLRLIVKVRNSISSFVQALCYNILIKIFLIKRKGKDTMRILVVEDEKPLSNILSEILKKNKYAVDAVFDGADGLEYALTEKYDVILLDIMLPKMNGMQMLSELRKKGNSTPVLLLTAKSEIEDKITGLDCGADDYITKPFETGELLARIRSVSRRKEIFVGNTQAFNDLTVDMDTLNLYTKNGTIKTSQKENRILEILLTNPNQIISKEQFVEKVWGYDFDGEYNSVEVYISFIRKKLKAIKSNVQIKAHRALVIRWRFLMINKMRLKFIAITMGALLLLLASIFITTNIVMDRNNDRHVGRSSG